jgi:BirA family biotin operon repressor/biotin-[acetyl-CoA-carboxylase] ligase
MFIKSTNSTNTLLKELLAKDEWQEGERYIRAGFQTAGRGQAGNGWESEADKNLLCSVLVESQKTKDKRPFYLNVAVSVAVCLLVKRSLSENGLSSLSEAVSIKWPNDIYWKDKKIAGILIENAIIGGEIKYSIAGIGLNVNQTEWHSDAPNPVSMKQIAESRQPSAVSRQIPDFNLDDLMAELLHEIDEGLRVAGNGVWDYYKAHLYRREGFWPFVEREVSIAPTMNAKAGADAFMARIKDILPTGEILLEDEQGKERIYHFKQVRYVVN